MSITRRKRKTITSYTGREIEYHLKIVNEYGGFIYNDWMTFDELVRLDGCEVSVGGLKRRVSNRNNVEVFTTLEGCVFTPKMAVRPCIVKNSVTERRLDREQENYDSQLLLIKLWPARKESGNELIMQSRRIC